MESHNSLGTGERYHEPFRRVLQKIRYSGPDVNAEHALRLAVKAMNDTMNPEGHVPSLLVSGVPLCFSAMNSQLPNQEDRMRAMQVAKTEMETIASELRLCTALLSKLPIISNHNLQIEQKVLVFREKEKPCKWTGPYKVIRLCDKQVFIDGNGEEVQHSIAQVKPYVYEPQEEAYETFYSMLKPFSSMNQELIEVNITEVLHSQDPR